MIPTARRPQLLQRTLDSLAKCEWPACDASTIVIENGSQTGAEEVVKSCAEKLRVHYIFIDRANKSHALNIAIEELADDCLVYFTDDDVRFSENVLIQFTSVAEGVLKGTFWGGSTAPDFEVEPEPWLKPMLPIDARPFDKKEYEQGSRYMVFLGFNWAAFAGDIRKAGGFDSRFGPGGSSGSVGQESDMQQRLLELGVRPVFLPEARVWHYVPPERCSPDWIIGRDYRYGILDAIKSHPRPTNSWGIPWWYLRRLGRTWIRYQATRLGGDRMNAFLAKRDFYYQKGLVKGLWSARETRFSQRTHA
jgi:glycosyltransferase involved in cell wall biosynthesis